MRQQIYDKALNLASTQRRLSATIREYNSAHGFEQADRNTEKLNEVRRKGGDLGGALNRAGQAHEISDLSFPEYSCPMQNMRAAEAAAAELPYLQGEDLHQQMRRVRQLIATANRQQRETEATTSKGHHDPPLEIGRASCRERV